MLTSRAGGRREGQSWSATIWTLAGGIVLIAVYLLVLDWGALVHWVKTVLGPL